MTTHVICSRCGKPMRPVVSDGTDAPTQGFCFCPPPVGWGHYTLAPVDWRDAELAALRAELEQERSRSSESSGETTGSDERGTVDPAEIRRLHGLIAALRAQYAGSQAALTTALGELAEARADLARFEAALDAANKELAQARAERDEYRHLYTSSELDRIKAVEKAERMQDNAMFFAQRYDEYSLVTKDTIDRSRRTIRALVVAARAMCWAIDHMASDEQRAYFRGLAKTEVIFMRRFGVTSDRDAGEAVMKIWNERAARNQTTHD